jgi:phosphatidylinositol 4-kinase
MLIHRCLPIDKTSKQNRNVATIGCRFKLLQCGLALLQGNTIPKSLARNILRERIYGSALDFFCGLQMVNRETYCWKTLRSL